MRNDNEKHEDSLKIVNIHDFYDHREKSDVVIAISFVLILAVAIALDPFKIASPIGPPWDAEDLQMSAGRLAAYIMLVAPVFIFVFSLAKASIYAKRRNSRLSGAVFGAADDTRCLPNCGVTLNEALSGLASLSALASISYFKQRSLVLIAILFFSICIAGASIGLVHWTFTSFGDKKYALSENNLQNVDAELTRRRIQGIIAIAASVLIYGVFWIFRWGWRYFAKTPDEIFHEDPRSPILWLRSFSDDSQAISVKIGDASWNIRLEELFAKHLRQFGPIISIGRPGELLPETGTARFYYADSEWQSKVLEAMAESQLIMVYGGTTAGLQWEIHQIRDFGHLSKTVFAVFVSDKIELALFIESLSEQLGVKKLKAADTKILGKPSGLFCFRVHDGKLAVVGSIGGSSGLNWARANFPLVLYAATYPIFAKQLSKNEKADEL